VRENPPNALSGAAVDKPVVLKSMGGMSIRVVRLAEGLSHPNGLVFLPDRHTMLITERAGRLRVVKDGVLDPNPVVGVPASREGQTACPTQRATRYWQTAMAKPTATELNRYFHTLLTWCFAGDAGNRK
jgi:glucose/arabinose dehydrogenase